MSLWRHITWPPLDGTAQPFVKSTAVLLFYMTPDRCFVVSLDACITMYFIHSIVVSLNNWPLLDDTAQLIVDAFLGSLLI